MIGGQGRVVMRGNNKVHNAGEEKNGDLLMEEASNFTRCNENLLFIILISLL